jgi:hypothetical protein
MESTAFDMILIPVVLATIGALTACWLISTLTGWASQVVNRLLGHHDEAVDPWDLQEESRCLEWRRHVAMDSRDDTSSSEVGPNYRRRLAG